jgi:NADH-quinone oxidoreductase subunit J
MNYDFLVIYCCIFLVISSILIINFSNTVFSLLMLVLNFLIAFLILLLLNCEFLSFIFLLIYVGAIVILFLFLFMLLDIKFKSLSKDLIDNYFFYYILFIIIILFIYCKNPNITVLFTFIDWRLIVNSMYDINIYSKLLYNNFIFEFLLIGIILLLVLVGVIFIINNYINLNSKYPNSIKQVSVRSRFFY